MTDGTATQQQRRRRIIERPRLTRLLDDSHARIKLLVAPAGYGKTTLARQWTADVPCAWYRASASAVDVASVARGLATAAANVIPECNRRLDERLRVTKNPDAEFATLAEILVEDIADWPQDAWLVFDDAQHLLERDATSEFVSAIVRDSRVNALLCTRQRPSWITARDLLYGQALEIGRNSLAMTHEEAAEVMRDTPATPGVVALADGWPAVVGLASLTPEPTLMSGMTAGLPEALYDYLVEELYQALPPDVQDSMCLIAVAGVRSRQLVERLFPERDREKALREVIEAGWLTADADANFELHPLLETFLRDKLEQEPTPDTRAKAKRVSEVLIAERHWDEAFGVIQRYGIDEQLLPLLRAALDDLLATGARTRVLGHWLENSDRMNVAGSERDLALRNCSSEKGSSTSPRCVRSPRPNIFPTGRLDKQGVRRGWSSGPRGKSRTGSVRSLRTARETSMSQRDLHVQRLVSWSPPLTLSCRRRRFCSCDLSPARRRKGLVPHISRALGVSTRFGTPADIGEARRVYRLLHLVPDPLTRCSYRNTYGFTVASAADVEEAAAVVSAQLEDAHRYRLGFVIPYAHLIEALLELVRGRFSHVSELLARTERAGKAAADDLLSANCIAIRTRSLIAQGQFAAATKESMRTPGAVTPSMHGELIASRAIALACERADSRALTDGRGGISDDERR